MSLILSGTDGLSDVDGSAATPAIRGTDANTGIFFPAADTIAFSEGGAEVMRIDSSGNVGIGTTSPLAKLNVVSTSANLYIGYGVNYDNYFQSNGSNIFTNANGSVEYGRFDSSGNWKFNSGYGSAATAYGCRAWVNFNGTGTVAIRASGNVTSITDHSTGNYTVNFTTAMPDANYCVTGTASRATLVAPRIVAGSTTVPATGSVRIQSGEDSGTAQDCEFVNIAIFR